MVTYEKFGDAFNALRKELGLTQEQAATALGVKRQAVGRWERGDRSPYSTNISRICRAFNVRYINEPNGTAVFVPAEPK